MAFVAEWPGICDDCGKGFDAGAWVAWNEDQKVVHAKCPTTRMGTVCSVCNETRSLSGSCACD